MNPEYEHLFNCCCAPYEHLHFPDALKANPIKAYGIYAFEEGFKLALHLTATILTENDFDPTIT